MLTRRNPGPPSATLGDALSELPVFVVLLLIANVAVVSVVTNQAVGLVRRGSRALG